ncbi:12616_t:CDS:2 [Cetraspora pellucida]|uniref:12616_t:CDS:1 n=1 Tax=Cetraspora pellucida TaxID=1433469 RepID=A0A9N9AXX7_9GLOM|nr:12616_t:CDS:2 [Cetraspora pellucida]
MQEFSQVAYLSPSVKRDKLAKKLIDMNKIKKYEVEELSRNIYVEVESETMPGVIYTTCVYGQPTDICCQCLDFLQRGIICKHLHAAALYIEDLRKQEQYSYLPEMTFLTYQESQNIRSNIYANESEIPTKILTYIGHILRPNTPIEVSQSNVPTSASTLQKYNIADIDDLNAAAIYQQEIKEFLESTSKSQEHFNCSDQNALLSHLHNVVNLDAFKKAQNLVNNIHKETDHRRLVVSDTGIIPLERKKKQQQKPLYKS